MQYHTPRNPAIAERNSGGIAREIRGHSVLEEGWCRTRHHQPSGGLQRHSWPHDGRDGPGAEGRGRGRLDTRRRDRGHRPQRVLLRARPGPGPHHGIVHWRLGGGRGRDRPRHVEAGHSDGRRLRDRIRQHHDLHVRLHGRLHQVQVRPDRAQGRQPGHRLGDRIPRQRGWPEAGPRDMDAHPAVHRPAGLRPRDS